jgi:hypothetical protein
MSQFVLNMYEKHFLYYSSNVIYVTPFNLVNLLLLNCHNIIEMQFLNFLYTYKL